MIEHNSAETVGSEILWSTTLFREQKEQANMMRSTLMECDKSDPLSVRVTLQNIKTQRIYHQIIRIIRYTEEMDKIENTLYAAIDAVLDNIDLTDYEDSILSMKLLLDMQERLQKSMIDSQKLLDPYLNIKELTYIDIPAQEVTNDLISGQVLDQDSRKKLREGAQELLDTISSQ